jgi:hypothetical protein
LICAEKAHKFLVVAGEQAEKPQGYQRYLPRVRENLQDWIWFLCSVKMQTAKLGPL